MYMIEFHLYTRAVQYWSYRRNKTKVTEVRTLVSCKS